MAYQVLARKWRPQNFDDLVGQESVVRTLKNAIETDRLAHAFLFTGVRGVGKTSSARLLAKALDCEQGPTVNPCNNCSSCLAIQAGSFIDVLEIDGASNTSVDHVRELRDNIQYLPSKAKFKIYIIDEIHMLSKAAFNALLKTLEEPPSGVVFIFATTEPQKLPETILSRCQRFDFKRVPKDVIVKRLETILTAEDIKADSGVLRALANEAQGSMRDALTLTDRLLAYCGNHITEEQARQVLGLVNREVIIDILKSVVNNQPADVIKAIHHIYKDGFDLKLFLESLLTEIRHSILIKSGLDFSQIGINQDELRTLEAVFIDAKVIELERYFNLIKRAIFEIGRSDHENYLVEVLLIQMCHVKGQFVAIEDALSILGSGELPEIKKKPVKTETQQSTGAVNTSDTIEDPYVKQAVDLFGATVAKVQIRDENGHNA